MVLSKVVNYASTSAPSSFISFGAGSTTLTFGSRSYAVNATNLLNHIVCSSLACLSSSIIIILSNITSSPLLTLLQNLLLMAMRLIQVHFSHLLSQGVVIIRRAAFAPWAVHCLLTKTAQSSP